MVEVQVRTAGILGVKLGLSALLNPKLPFLEPVMVKSARILADEVRARAKGGIRASVRGGYFRRVGAQLHATVSVSHPGSRSMEFGRQRYYRGMVGNNRPGSKRERGSVKRTGRKFISPRGQASRPFIGIKHGDAAIGASKVRIEELLAAEILAEWERRGMGKVV